MNTPVLLLVFASSLPTASTPVPEDLARVVLARSLHSSAGRILCVAIDDRDPPSGMLENLEVPKDFVVLPTSACKYTGEAGHERAIETKSGEPAEFLYVSDYQRNIPGRDTVKVTRRAGAWQGHGAVLEVYRKDDAWHIGDRVETAIE